MCFIAHIKFSVILGSSFLHEYIVLLSVKLQISNFSPKKKILLMIISNNSGPDIEPCGIPQKISSYLLHKGPTSVLCYLRLR